MRIHIYVYIYIYIYICMFASQDLIPFCAIRGRFAENREDSRRLRLRTKTADNFQWAPQKAPYTLHIFTSLSLSLSLSMYMYVYIYIYT